VKKQKLGKTGERTDFTGAEEIITSNPSTLADGQAVMASCGKQTLARLGRLVRHHPEHIGHALAQSSLAQQQRLTVQVPGAVDGRDGQGRDRCQDGMHFTFPPASACAETNAQKKPPGLIHNPGGHIAFTENKYSSGRLLASRFFF